MCSLQRPRSLHPKDLESWMGKIPAFPLCKNQTHRLYPKLLFFSSRKPPPHWFMGICQHQIELPRLLGKLPSCWPPQQSERLNLLIFSPMEPRPFWKHEIKPFIHFILSYQICNPQKVVFSLAIGCVSPSWFQWENSCIWKATTTKREPFLTSMINERKGESNTPWNLCRLGTKNLNSDAPSKCCIDILGL